MEKFKTSVSRGVVERVSFRGDNLELQVRVNNSVVTARRSLEKADIREGETVNVFLYRIFALRGDSVQLIENEAVRDDFCNYLTAVAAATDDNEEIRNSEARLIGKSTCWHTGMEERVRENENRENQDRCADHRRRYGRVLCSLCDRQKKRQKSSDRRESEY